MNLYISSQITNMRLLISSFEKSCRLAALKDDGKIDKTEERQLKEISKAYEKFIKSLESVK